MKTTILRAFFTILTLTCFLYPSISYSEDYVFERQWPSEILGLRRPVGITVDRSGNVYVVDVTTNKMIKYNSSGNVLLTIGGNGSGIGQFYSPYGVAVDSLGNIYVADDNDRIQKFNSNGNYITQWGTYGDGDGQFSYPRGVAIDNLGHVYVADSSNDRIQKFDSNGNYITQWGTYGDGDGQFFYPSGVAVDRLGNVYVANNARIQKFDSNGTYITQLGAEGIGNGQFYNPHGVAIDSLGNVYVADVWNYRIQKFDSNGNYITKWGTWGSGNGQFDYPSGVAIDSLGNVFVADVGNSNIQKFDSNGTYITKWGTEGSENGQFSSPWGVAVDSLGNVYVADASNNHIQKFDSNGTYITKWGTEGYGSGQFSSPWGVAVDSLGNVYVADGRNNRIQKFDSNGNYITKWGVTRPTDVAVDSLGNVYVADTDNNRIQKFDSNGNYITKWETLGSGNGHFYPNGMAVNTLGKVYAATGYYRIQVFSLVNAPSCIKGDVNNDGNIKSNDATLILRIAAGLLEPDDYQKCAADFNGDGKIGSNDATLVLRKVAGLEAPAKNLIIDRHIGISLSEAHGLKSETIAVPITVDNIDILSSGDMSISYDSRVLRAINILSSDGLLMANNISQPGLIRISFAGVDRLNDGKLAEIKFEVLMDDVSPLTFKMAELYGTDALPLNSKFTNKQFRSWAVAPERSALLQNYPNPFNPETWIPYQLHEASEVVIRIHNIIGELVREIRLGYKPAGLYISRDRSAYWDGRNEAGERVASGLYFYTIQTGKFTATGKMLMLK
jgi:DNA-binding beta-propeller fold protein YncE